MTTTDKFKFCLTLLSLMLCFGSHTFAQDSLDNEIELGIAPTIKLSGIAPQIGAAYQLNADSRLRALIFFSANTGGFRNDFLLDLSYIKTSQKTDNLDLYWGANLHLQVDEFLFAPGAIAGASYNIDKNVAIFGEAAFNAFFLTVSDYVEYGMLNSGIGLRVAL